MCTSHGDLNAYHVAIHQWGWTSPCTPNNLNLILFPASSAGA